MFYTFFIWTLFILISFHVFIRYSRKGRLINKIPGPKPLPFIGNLLVLNDSLEKLFYITRNFLDKYYPIVRIWSIKNALVFIGHPDDLKILLTCNKNISKCHAVYSNLKFCGNDGLIVSSDEKWWHRRKLLNHAFHTSVLKSYAEIADEHTKKLIASMKFQGREAVYNLMPLLFKLNFEIICEAAMGVDINKFGAENAEIYNNGFDEISKISFYRAVRPYICDWMMHLLSIGRKQKRLIKFLYDVRDKIIQERRDYHERIQGYSFQEFSKKDSPDDNDDVAETSSDKRRGDRKRLALLDLLLSAEKDGLIDSQGVAEEVDTFLSAGYETTATAIVFTLLVLAENKKAQDLARAEVCNILNKSQGSSIVTVLSKFEYLERCIKESLRLFPSAPMIGRSVTKEIRLKDYVLPVGTEVFMDIYAVHRDPHFWPEPNKFDPDRFLPENVKSRHTHAYLPFSAGPRSCIGQKFSMMFVKTVVARILYNFYLEPVDLTAKLKFELQIVLKPTSPLRAKLIKIDQN